MTAGDRSNYNYYRNVAAVQIDPHFSSTSTFYSGGIAGKCVRNSKAWLRFSNQDFTIHDGEGPITTMKWGGAMLAWANNQGVKIYDTSKNMRISYVQRPAKMAAVCRCHLMWESVDSLLIGWADSIKIVALKPRMNPSTKKMQVVAEITSVIETPFIICGICPFGPHNLAVLAYVTEDADDNDDSDGGGGGAAAAGPRSPVELRILNRRNGEPLSEDELPLKDFSAFGPTDFSLEALDRSQKPGQALAGGGPNSYPTMYVVSPRDIVVAQPRDAKDKIMWAKNAGHYSLALRLCKEYPSALSADAVAAIGERYLVELTSDQLPAEQRNFPLAAKLCPELLGDDVDRWEQWVTLFFAMGQLTAIEPYLPTENPRLNKGTYEMVLNHFLTNGDMPTFLHLMKKFEKAGRGKSRGSVLNNKFNPHHGPAPGFPNTSPPDSSRSESAALFAVEPILMKVEWELKSNKHPEETMLMLKDAKAYLLCMEGHYTEALEVFIIDPQPRKVLHFDVFRLIEDHELFSMVANENIFALLTTHEKKAIDMLVCNVKHFDILAVYQLLKTRPTLCLKYLDALVFKRFDLYDDERFEEMHKHQLQLYAQYQPEGLLKFMRTSSYISLTEALEVCEKNVYHNTAAATAALMSSSNQESKQNNIPPDLTTQRIEILSQMQRYGEALDILILELGDMEEAVRFVKRCEDDRGWADLVDRAIDIFARYEPQPLEALRKDRILEFTTLLLDSIGDHPSAQALIAQLPDAIARHVQKLPLKFKEIIFQHRVRHSMYTCGRSIALCDIAAWHRQMVRAQQLANRVQLRDTQNEAECVCPACQFPLRLDSRIPGPQGTSSKLIVFGCGHVYHDQCLTKMLEAQVQITTLFMALPSPTAFQMRAFLSPHLVDRVDLLWNVQKKQKLRRRLK
eukprot:INCI15785.2.p1 GENE.INCI15785.2~~INCI15785.2.p1  ORF type:complete len:1069 (-),score=202.37 INCI15785.2:381-3107(-)